MALLEIRDLSFRYNGAASNTLSNVDLSLEEGQIGIIFGLSGCGKTTLLRLLKPSVSPAGESGGTVLYDGKDIKTLSERTSVAEIGYVTQDPDGQIVTDKVWHELAYGLESLGADDSEIRRRVAEISSFFGITPWLHSDTASLSGGQKQILNLASVMVCRPRLLILDEPTAQLDPIASSDFISIISKLNKELGTTVLMAEHRLDQSAGICDLCAFMSEGRLRFVGSMAECAKYVFEFDRRLSVLLPCAVRISLYAGGPIALTVPEARECLRSRVDDLRPLQPQHISEDSAEKNVVLHGRDLFFRYGKESPDVLKGFSLDVREGEWVTLFGANGSGKSTALSVLAGIEKNYSGKIRRPKRISYVPQNVCLMFSQNTVQKELQKASASENTTKELLVKFALADLAESHPFDLSGGEAHRLAVAVALSRDPELLVLDEPTSGLDAVSADLIGGELDRFVERGNAVIMASHDVDFAAAHSTRCAMMFDGALTAEDSLRDFIKGNSFYTTAARRIARDMIPEAFTARDVICSLTGKEPEGFDTADTDGNSSGSGAPIQRREAGNAEKVITWRRIVGIVFAILGIAGLIYTAVTGGFSEFARINEGTDVPRLIAAYSFLILCFALSAVCFGIDGRKRSYINYINKEKISRPVSSGAISILSTFVLIPLSLWFGVKYLSSGQYYITATAVLVLCLVPFYISFERKRPKARDVVAIAVICALGVASRAAFFMVPQFKPVLALCVLVGASFGAETGFICGSVTMLVSNLLFSQGPWTPWQMYAMGLVGFLAGMFFRRAGSRRRIPLALFGAFSAVVIYGGIMNPITALLWAGDSLNASLILTYYLTGLPLDLIHAAASVIFISLFADPMLEKFERLKVKYNVLNPIWRNDI